MKPKTEKQIKNGVRLGLGFAALFVGLFILTNGIGRIFAGEFPPHHIVWLQPMGWLQIAVGTAMLIATADIWWQLLAGCMLYGFSGGVFALITGSSRRVPFGPVPRPLALELIVASAATMALMYRFHKGHVTVIDRVALTLYVFTFAFWYRDSSSDYSRGAVAFGAGLAVLAIAWGINRWKPRKRRPASHHSITTQSTHPESPSTY